MNEKKNDEWRNERSKKERKKTIWKKSLSCIRRILRKKKKKQRINERKNEIGDYVYHVLKEMWKE